MNIQSALRTATIDRLESEVLLCALLGRERTWLIAHSDTELRAPDEVRWHTWLKRRSAGEPVAYITGEREFYSRTFATDPRALIPRPCTESLVTLALSVLEDSRSRQRVIDSGIVGVAHVRGPLQNVSTIVDLGTGTGCIGITLALERPDLRVILTDISGDALALASQNARMLGARVELRQGSALEPVADLAEPFLLVSNPPYIPDADPLPRDVAAFEPHIALRAGPDGRDVIRTIITQAKAHPQCRGWVVECLESQESLLE